MKILVITQKVDKNDPVLGFFHQWINKLSPNFELIKVICLEKGEFSLSENVEVMSLGKEERISKIKYILNFYKYIWKERKEYEAVLVHMNQEYVLLGGLIWKILGKKIFLWRNHPQGNWLTRVAVWLVNKVFYTSKFSYTARFKKAVEMPVGIETEKYKNTFIKNKEKNRGDVLKILYLGRIAPVKNVGVVLGAGKILKEKGVRFKMDIIGDYREEDEGYFNSLKEFVLENKLGEEIKFLPGVANFETPEVYGNYDLMINATKTGSMDKTIFEAMASGLVILTSNKTLFEFFGEKYVNLLTFKEGDEESCALKVEDISEFLKKNESRKMLEYLREKTEKEHSLDRLTDKLSRVLKGMKNV